MFDHTSLHPMVTPDAASPTEMPSPMGECDTMSLLRMGCELLFTQMPPPAIAPELRVIVLLLSRGEEPLRWRPPPLLAAKFRMMRLNSTRGLEAPTRNSPPPSPNGQALSWMLLLVITGAEPAR